MPKEVYGLTNEAIEGKKHVSWSNQKKGPSFQNMLHTYFKFPVLNYVPTDPTPLYITCLITDTLPGTSVEHLYSGQSLYKKLERVHLMLCCPGSSNL